MMLSVIICSRKQTISSILSENVRNTIGCDYELVVIDNSENIYSIFEAYNLGIEKSVNDDLCFIHDDILFHTEGWGNKVKDIFNDDPKIGLIGVAGSKIKTKMPSSWWDCPDEKNVINIVQHFSDKTRKKEKMDFGFGKEKNIEVAVIDGVFMAMRKNNHIGFSTKMKGFHNYDLNISFECKKHGFKTIVTNEILIEHFSIGNIDKSWYKSTHKIHQIYRKNLPIIIDNYIDSEDIKRLEIINAKKFINQCVELKQYKLAFLVWSKLFILHPFLKFHLKLWLNFTVKISEQIWR